MPSLPDEVRLRVGPAQVRCVSGSDAVARLRRLRPLLATLGRHVAKESQGAFEKQAWDGQQWPERYPSQGAPKLNIIGFLKDVAKGAPKERRFVDRPALVDTGALRKSVRSRVVSDVEVEVGSALEYADAMQRGGETTLDLTPTMRRKTLAFLGKRPEFWPRLGFVVRLRPGFRAAFRAAKKVSGRKYPDLPTAAYQNLFYGVKNRPRTFLASTPRIEAALARVVEKYLQTGTLPASAEP